ncbi:MAG: hypothetical protein IKU54_00755 [Oscillospiraceae bacterium]|nr:hypothetical protein [Oscillospiraceae bacterium]
MKVYITKSEATGKNIVVDDMILTTDMPTTAGSKMLDGYMSLFEAQAVTALKENGYTICGKANTGEFNLDLLGETSHFGPCEENGVLKGAAAQTVKMGDAMAAVTLEVNGSSARAAALAGLVMMKPTYGTVSRFGTIPAACSGETVCVTAADVDTVKEVLTALKGHDDKDGTSLPQEKCVLGQAMPAKKVAVAKSLLTADADTLAKVEAVKAKLIANGVEVVEIEAEQLLLAKSAWNILMSAELCNNVSKYDGVKYGYRTPNYTNIDELYTNSRTEAFGYLTKSTVLFGSETLSEANYFKVYDKAQRIRRVISEYLTAVFAEYDAILAPVCSKTEYTVEETAANKYMAYEESTYTAPSMITGIPVVVTGGVQLMGAPLSDAALLAMAETL